MVLENVVFNLYSWHFRATNKYSMLLSNSVPLLCISCLSKSIQSPVECVCVCFNKSFFVPKKTSFVMQIESSTKKITSLCVPLFHVLKVILSFHILSFTDRFIHVNTSHLLCSQSFGGEGHKQIYNKKSCILMCSVWGTMELLVIVLLIMEYLHGMLCRSACGQSLSLSERDHIMLHAVLQGLLDFSH